MLNVVTITGIRPDFIRMSGVFNKLDCDGDITHTLIHSGQHYDDLLSGVFFDDLKIRKPDYNLNIGMCSNNHYEQQAVIGPRIIKLLQENNIRADIILFLGDSNSVLASVPLKKEGYKIGHIEAGMRSFDMRMLEEINRKVCDHVSDYLFVYHQDYKENLINEGICPDKIFTVGNTINEPLNIIKNKLSFPKEKSHIILDVHRPENFKYQDRLKSIIKFSEHCSNRFGLPVKLLNFEKTTYFIKKYCISLNKINLVPLMGYKKFVKFMMGSSFMISDSGTAQEEASLLNIPVVVPRDYTERPQSMAHDCSVLLSLNGKKNWSTCIDWLMTKPKLDSSWLGEGESSTKILSSLKKVL